MKEQELLWLAKQAVEHRCIVEIGSYLGRSTRALLDHTSGEVYAIDDWKGPRDVYLTKQQRRDLFYQFIKNTDWINRQHKLHVVSCDHANIPISMENIKPDMVFIDGSHEYEDTKRDIEYWLPRIVPGGLISGHDINFDTVQQAVEEVFGEDYSVPENTTIWMKGVA